MPIRIKPNYDLKPCRLNLNSINRITKVIDNNFTDASYSASNNIWEIFDENRTAFLEHISERETLDSFIVKASDEFPEESADNSKEIEIIFDENQATVSLTAHPKYSEWFEHFLIDLKKHLLVPSTSQLIAKQYGSVPDFYFRFLLVSIPIAGLFTFQVPYCKIEIQKKPESPFVENVKANLFSNAIWAILGIILTLLAQLILKQFGIDLNPFD